MRRFAFTLLAAALALPAVEMVNLFAKLPG